MTEAHPDHRPDRVYLRDASWHATIGRASQFHWPRLEDPALAACSSNTVLLSGEDTGWLSGEDPADVSQTLRCRRRGCAEKWAAWDDGEWYRTMVKKAAAEWAGIKGDAHTGYSDDDVCFLCWAGDGDPRCQRCGCSVGMPGCQCSDGYLAGPCHALVTS